jgi:hypothetical protein
MKSIFFAFLIWSMTVFKCFAAIEVTAELMAYREKKETASGQAESAKKAVAPPKASSQEKVIAITLRNSARRPESELLVRYWFIGRDMKTFKVSLLDGGQSSAELKPGGTFVMNSDPVKGTVTRKAASPGKMGEVSGIKIVGYGVQVIKGDRVVGETFLESEYKKLVGSEGKSPGPFFKILKPDGEAQ